MVCLPEQVVGNMIPRIHMQGSLEVSGRGYWILLSDQYFPKQDVRPGGVRVEQEVR